MQLHFRVINDALSTRGLDAAFTHYWPAYQRWMMRAPQIPLAQCVAQLRRHMPELEPLFEYLLDRFGGTEDAARFLTAYNPPRLVRACTQLMLDTSDGPVLLRSYDHAPRLIDGLVLHADWLGTRTLALTDCLWGALDGINEHGLAIALAFGGRNVVGDGFSAPLICRYILQTCTTVAAARAVLSRLPINMPYTFAVLDAADDFVTAFLGPDTHPSFVARRTSANHQGKIDWPEYARFVGTSKRLTRVERLLRDNVPPADARKAFLSPPIWRNNYAKGSGTLYVAEYAVKQRSLTLHWPGQSERFDLAQPVERPITVEFRQGTLT